MSKKSKSKQEPALEEELLPEQEILDPEETEVPFDGEIETEEPETAETPDLAAENAALNAQLASAQARLAEFENGLRRMAAEYDNYRKRTARELESAGAAAAGETAAAFLPVYDNLERALKQETADAAFKKGVEITMNQLKEIFAKLGIEEIPALGQPFDPNVHNAVMHVEDESLEENIITEVFQAGFRQGDKIIRFAMVQVAN